MPGTRSVSLLAGVLAAAVLAPTAPASLDAQTRGSVVGSVVDEADDAPLEGATISVLSTDLSAVTDEQGEFILPHVPLGQATVKVEQPGYSSVVQTVDVSRADVTFLQVRLPRMEALLREILVRTGRRPASGGVEAEVRRRDDGRSNTAADLLADRVPGVDVTWGSGIVGQGAAIRIRGISSISLSNAPAVYLDGIRIDEGGGATAAGKAALTALEQIPAEQVERIRVLRGPSAAARYAESANGIILVETRRGGEDSGGGEEGDGEG